MIINYNPLLKWGMNVKDDQELMAEEESRGFIDNLKKKLSRKEEGE